MFWTWKHNESNETYVSWGEPRLLNSDEYSEAKPDFDVDVYDGKEIQPEDSIIYMMQGDASLGFGDSIWLISYLRDIFSIKAKRKNFNFHICSSSHLNKFYSNFLPKTITYRDNYVTKKEFDSFTHKLPAMYYWNAKDGSNKAWIDNKSILERLYDLTGMQYAGLPDFGEFTNEELLYPNNEFYEKNGINKQDKYVFFQWHTSGNAKNIPASQNIKLIRHIIKQYGLKVYIIGRLNNLDDLEKINGVVNLSGKTNATELIPLASQAEFIVSPDSAGIHLGEAYRVPTVGIIATLPPVYIAKNYKIPSFMFGSNVCPHRPCGHVHTLPKHKCPHGTGQYCYTLENINLEIFDKCIKESIEKRKNYKSKKNINFYESYTWNLPINL